MEILHLITNLDAHIAGFINLHGDLIYLLLFGIVFAEIGLFPLFFLPGNPLIFIAGSFCKLGSLNLSLTVATLIIANFLGNLLSYQLGKLFGLRIQHSRSRWVNQKALAKTRLFYASYGFYTLAISPFIAVVRTFAPLLAGVSEMHYYRYLIASSIGGVVWVVVLVFCGYFFSSFAIIQHHMASIVLGGLAIGLACVLYGLVRSKNQPK